MRIQNALRASLVGVILAGSLGMQAAQADGTLYQQFGEKPGITALIDTFVGNVAADNRINGFFAHTNIPHLKEMLVLQVCQGVGGPCTYPGRDMKTAHQGMGVTEAAFNALTEDMIKAMEYHHIPLGAQNKLIAVLAPMKYPIVTK